ncbi:nucleoside deaminase [candidate division WOR-3 bacterium]|nr:nucleoside deaminase [candidate division WOR-3 bacterium]
MNDENFMQVAIEKARYGVQNGQSPFGACVVKNGEVISSGSNTVWKDGDITAHAEINSIRKACKKLNSVDLSGCIVYSTCEPCPMCFTACYWARVSKIVYGARIKDAKRFGFNEMLVSNEQMKSLSKSKIEIKVDFLRDECIEIFKQWALQKDRKTY